MSIFKEAFEKIAINPLQTIVRPAKAAISRASRAAAKSTAKKGPKLMAPKMSKGVKKAPNATELDYNQMRSEMAAKNPRGWRGKVPQKRTLKSEPKKLF